MTQEHEYTIIAHEEEDGGYWTEVPALPGVGSQGDSLEEAIENTKEAIALMLEHLAKKGEPIPHPKEVIVKVTVTA